MTLQLFNPDKCGNANKMYPVLDPIPTTGLTAADVDQLTKDTREKMLKAITAMGQDSNSQSFKSKKES